MSFGERRQRKGLARVGGERQGNDDHGSIEPLRGGSVYLHARPAIGLLEAAEGEAGRRAADLSDALDETARGARDLRTRGGRERLREVEREVER